MLTKSQQAAHDRAYDACDHTIEGRFAKGQIVSDYSGQAWKITTRGIRYYEDVTSCIYGVQVCRGPKGWKQTTELRAAIESIRITGTHDVDSRGGWTYDDAGEFVDNRKPRPDGDKQYSWTDRGQASRMSSPTITVYAHDIVGVSIPNYDNSSTVAWVVDSKLAKRLIKAMVACPEAVVLPETHVKERKINLRIAEDSPRYAAYAAARDVSIYESTLDANHNANRPVGLTLPQIEWRRIKAELDAIDNA